MPHGLCCAALHVPCTAGLLLIGSGAGRTLLVQVRVAAGPPSLPLLIASRPDTYSPNEPSVAAATPMATVNIGAGQPSPFRVGSRSPSWKLTWLAQRSNGDGSLQNPKRLPNSRGSVLRPGADVSARQIRTCAPNLTRVQKPGSTWLGPSRSQTPPHSPLRSNRPPAAVRAR
jgi:hypothetical protein